MPVPDLLCLAAFHPDDLRAIARRLQQIGLGLDRVAPIVAAAAIVPPVLRNPIRAFHLRALKDDAGTAMRALLFRDPVSEAEAQAAFGEALVPMLAAGLLTRVPEGLVSPFVLSVFNDLFILSDDLVHGEDAVMGFGETTIELCRASYPARPLESALDLGCGSGTAALVLASAVKRVVGTDINPRAVALARVNAALNGIGNVEFRVGDLFAPVAGERFDLVVSQPPFIPRPEGAGEAVFLYGGARGDELSRSLLAQIEPHLGARGRAVLLIEWPELPGDPVPARVRAALGNEALEVIVLEAPLVSADEHAASYAAGQHPVLDRAFDAEALRRRTHLEALGIDGLRPTATLLQRLGNRPGKTWSLPVEKLGRIGLSSGRIDKLFAARSLIGQRARLLAATTRVPAGTVFAEEQVGPGADVESTLSARFADEALAQTTRMTPELLFLVTFLHESPDVQRGLEKFAEASEVSVDEAIERALPAVEQALLGGLLELA
ncbi:MAG: methyltransferase domain-containing protein [Minicystis sp.]